MAGKKFSEFTTSAMGAATSFLVGYDTVSDTNDRWDRTAVAGWLTPALSIDTIFTGGTMTTDATSTITAAGTSNFIFTGGVDNTVQIGNLTGTGGIGWKIQPATGNANPTRMYISDSNGKPVLSKHSDIYNNYGSSARAIALGIGTSDTTAGDRIAINQPNSFSNNAIHYTASNTDGSSLWVFGGKSTGSVYNTRAITAFGPMGNSSSTMYALTLYSFPGTIANPYMQDLLKVSNAGTVEIGATGQYQAPDAGGGAGTALIPAPILKVNGQSYTVLHDIGTVATATWDIDWNNSNIQSITLNNGGAMTLNTPTNPQTGATYILKLIQGASPSTVTWTASIFKWPAATAPTLSTTTAYVDVITLIYDGTDYLATSTLDLR